MNYYFVLTSQLTSSLIRCPNDQREHQYCLSNLQILRQRTFHSKSLSLSIHLLS